MLFKNSAECARFTIAYSGPSAVMAAFLDTDGIQVLEQVSKVFAKASVASFSECTQESISPERVKILIRNKVHSDPEHFGIASLLPPVSMYATDSVKSLIGNLVKAILLQKDKRVNPECTEAITKASMNGHVEVVRLLLKDNRVDPSANDNGAIIWASTRGHYKVVEMLINDKRVDPSARDNEAFKCASRHVKVMELFLRDKHMNLSAQDIMYVFKVASKGGHVEVVKLLLKDERVDPSAQDNYAIRWASMEGYTEVVELLKQAGCML